MSAIATGSQSQFSYLEEVTYGVTPSITPGDSQVVPFISNNLNLTKAIFEDPSIQPNRQAKFSRHGNREIAGDVSFAYAHEHYDAFLESLFSSSFTANVLKVAQIQKSFTMEVEHQDITQSRNFTGIVVNSLGLEVNLDGVVQSTFGLIGQDMTISATPMDSAPTGIVDKQPFVHFDGSFNEGGSPTAIVTGISINITSELQSNFALGDAALKCLTSAMFKVEGTVTAFFQDEILLNKFLNETESELSFTLDDGNGNTHTFLIPKIKYNGGDIQVADSNQTPITLPFIALFDSGEATNISVTRTA